MSSPRKKGHKEGEKKRETGGKEGRGQGEEEMNFVGELLHFIVLFGIAKLVHNTNPAPVCVLLPPLRCAVGPPGQGAMNTEQESPTFKPVS